MPQDPNECSVDMPFRWHHNPLFFHSLSSDSAGIDGSAFKDVFAMAVSAKLSDLTCFNDLLVGKTGSREPPA